MTATRRQTDAPQPLVLQRRRYENTVLHILGIGLVFVGVGITGCAAIEAGTDGGGVSALLASAVLFLGLGGALWRYTTIGPIATTTVFTSVAVTWFAVSILGAVPYLLAGTMQQPGQGFHVELVNALFESASGFSCTGSTVIADLPDLGDSDHRIGRGVLFWRQLTQWYGGMGIVLLVLAVLPALGVRAVGFIVAEAPGVSADRLAPRISETAKRLWSVYLGVTLSIAAGFWIAGMSLYDGLAHALATAATGGFSPYNDSIGEYASVAVELAAIAGMLLCGANFALHYRALAGDRLAHVRDSEFRWYVGFFATITTLVVAALWIDGGVSRSALRVGVFNSATLVSSTGFGNARGAGSAGDFTTWVPAAQIALLAAMVVGGSTGSTSGGIKITRFRVLGSQARLAVRAARHPRAVLPLKMGSDVVPPRTVDLITGFLVTWLAVAAAGTVFFAVSGTDLVTSLSGAISALGNMGPTLNNAGPAATFADAFDAPSRLVLAVMMIIGRLELFAVLLLLAHPLRRLRNRRLIWRPR